MLALTLLSLFGFVGRCFPERQPRLPAPTYVIRIPSLRAAEMSPDEEYMAVLVMHSRQRGAELQVWNFH